MNTSAIKQLERDLDRCLRRGLSDHDRDLLENAICCGGYRAEQALLTLAANMDRVGEHLAAGMIRQVINS